MTTTVHPINRKVPYFAVGHAFPEPVSVEQAFSQAGLRWHVEQRPLAWIGDPVVDRHTQLPIGKDINHVHRYENGSMMVRSDRNIPFGPVGSRYTEIQNDEVEELLENAGWRAVAAGHIDNGKRCFAVLNAGEYSEFTVNGDPFFAYVVARWNHDGSGGVKVGPQIWRQWCTNGQRRIEAQRMISIRHTSGKSRQLVEAASVIGQLGDTIQEFVIQAELLQSIRYGRTEADDLLKAIFPKPKQTKDVHTYNIAVKRWESQQADVRRILRGPTIGDWSHTAHGVVQAVNEYEQWSTNTKKIHRSQILRLDADRFPKTERALQLVGVR